MDRLLTELAANTLWREPEWAVDIGLLSRGLAYRFFKAIERYQYSVADVIGVQTSANLPYFEHWAQQDGRRVEVLQNWLADAHDVGSSISVADSVPFLSFFRAYRVVTPDH